MIQLLDKLTNEKQEKIAIVKMDIYTYENLVLRDEDGFSKEARADLERELDEIEK
jgi:hypothetical protein